MMSDKDFKHTRRSTQPRAITVRRWAVSVQLLGRLTGRPDLEDRVKRLKDEEEKQKQLAKEQKRAKKRKIDEDEPFVKGAVTDKQDTTREPEDNKKELQEAIKEAAPEMTEEERMLAMLGLPGGFGSSKK
jgi:outer membrane protein assembly factor BamE (lipoprotein component of BamABCDE complex)